MRPVLAAPLLTLLACTLDNPLFIVESASEAPPASSTTDVVTTSATDSSATTPTTSATGSTNTTSMTGMTSMTSMTGMTGMTGDTGETDVTTTGASTTLPAGTSEGSISAGDTGTSEAGGDPDMGGLCMLLKAANLPDRHIYSFFDKQNVNVCVQSAKLEGRLKVVAGALTITDPSGCQNAAVLPKYRLGNEFPLLLAENTAFKCVAVTIFWAEGFDCLISSMMIHDTDTDELLFAAAFSSLNFAFEPELAPLDDACGCPGEDGCCMPFPDPGNYALQVAGSDPIDPGEVGQIDLQGNSMWLHNIQAWIDESCRDGAVDWFLEPKL